MLCKNYNKEKKRSTCFSQLRINQSQLSAATFITQVLAYPNTTCQQFFQSGYLFFFYVDIFKRLWAGLQHAAVNAYSADCTFVIIVCRQDHKNSSYSWWFTDLTSKHIVGEHTQTNEWLEGIIDESLSRKKPILQQNSQNVSKMCKLMVMDNKHCAISEYFYYCSEEKLTSVALFVHHADCHSSNLVTSGQCP